MACSGRKKYKVWKGINRKHGKRNDDKTNKIWSSEM
jgi:hypothetical protein